MGLLELGLGHPKTLSPPSQWSPSALRQWPSFADECPRLLYVDSSLPSAVGVSVTYHLSLLSAMLSDASPV